MDVAEQLRSSLSDRYRIEREIGAGGMATVYLAEDLKHRRRVALKVLRPELAAVLGPARFLSEINVTASLQHPHLLPLFDSGEVNGLLFYVMPFIAGESLRTRLDRERQLPVDEAVRIATAVAGGLDCAHRHDVIHRDLKPENILLHDGQPLIADFGIALAVSNAGGARVTQTGLSLGTPAYMSPEQATGDRVIDARSDIYSLAAVLYEMLTGEPPHTGPTVQAIIARLLTEEPPSARTHRSAVPPHVDAAIRKALAKLPADRFLTAQQFCDALQNPHWLPAAEAGGNVAVRKRAPRERLLAAAPWVVTAIAAAGAVWSALPSRPLAPLPTGRFAIDVPESVLTDVDRSQFRISTNGQLIAFTAVTGTGGRAIFVRRLDDAEPHVVRGTEDAVGGFPIVSPDAQWIVYRARDGVRRIPVAGGASRALTDSLVGRGDWGTNNMIVVGRQRSGLWMLDAETGQLTRFTLPDTAAGERHNSPRYLPDGSVLFSIVADNTSEVAIATSSGKITRLGITGTRPAYAASGHLVYGDASGALMAIPFDARKRKLTGEPVSVLEGIENAAGGPLWDMSANGTLVYVTGSSLSQIVMVDRNGNATPVAQESRAFRRPRPSPDGKRIVVEVRPSSAEPAADLWVYEMASATLSRLTFDGGMDPVWSPDGSHIVFSIRRIETDANLFMIRSDGSGRPDTLLVAPWNQFALAYSPDGRTIVFDQTFQGNIDILLLDVATRAITPFLKTPFVERLPYLSPDGKWIAYTSNESGSTQVYVRPFPGPGGRVQISTDFGDEPTWSADGREVFYRDGRNMVAAEVRREPAFAVVGRKNLFRDHFVRGGTLAYDVHPDNKHFVMLKAPEAGQRFVVLTNWTEELRRKTAKVRPTR